MDNRLSKNVMGLVSTRGLLLSNAYQPHNSIPITENEDRFAVSTKKHVKLGPKLIDTVRHKLNYGSKLLPFGREEIFLGDSEPGMARSCCMPFDATYTQQLAIRGILFISTEKVAFCSEKSIKTYSTTLEVLNFQYKVSIPLEKIKGVEESTNLQRPSKKYVELVTVDDFSFLVLWVSKLQENDNIPPTDN